MEMALFNVSASSLFVTSSQQSAQMESLAKRQLSNGLELFVNKKYDEAINTLKRAVSLAPLSSTATQAYDYMAKSYLNKGNSPAAIEAYQQSLRSNPTHADSYLALGNIYVTENQIDKAQSMYAQAVRLEGSAVNRYSLGQAYLEGGQYEAAVTQFKLVKQQAPTKPNGDYGLGLAYAKQGKTDEAISAFRQAISLQKDFWEAHVELGYALMDAGEKDKAQEVADTLSDNTASTDLASTLNQYIYEKTPAEMMSVYATSTFQRTLGAGTKVADLGDYLVDAGGQQTFSMVFQFSKQMDELSIENVRNWSVTRSLNTGRGDAYNFGIVLPSTEVALSRYPVSVSYNAEDQTATVLFRVDQNATADGTIDPAHIKFSFSGTDVLGIAMNPKADQYSGFNGFA